MKKRLSVLFIFLLCLCFYRSVKAEPLEGYTENARVIMGSLSLVSFCDKWDEASLNALYNELLLNTTGQELSHLSHIYIYPDSPNESYGRYRQEFYINNLSGETYVNRYIELYKGDEIDTVEKMAPHLSHEYGHHYTIFNMSVYENSDYSLWAASEYAKIRGLSNYPVVYDDPESVTDYEYKWDIAEIAANDYVQLLGSQTAKKSFKYLDNLEFINSNDSYSGNVPLYFNANPQANLYIPLAANAAGLYEYLLKAAGFNPQIGKIPYIKTLPEIISLTSEEAHIDKTYTLNFSEASGNGPFEYTIVMFPISDMYNYIHVIKTVENGKPCEAVFGSIFIEQGNKLTGVNETYSGLYEIRIYAKDKNGYIYSSVPKLYNFDYDNFEDSEYFINTAG